MKVRSARFGRIALVVVGALLVLAPVALWAQSDDARRRAVGDWLVEDVAEQDGMRTVQVRREEGDYSLDYHMWLRPGANRVESHGFLVARLNCGQGMEESTEGDQDTPVEATAVRARLADYLDRCQAPAEDQAALLEGFERAFHVADDWAAERLAEFAAMDATEMGDMGMDANMTEMDMSVMDMNSTTDMNATADPQ